MNGRPLTADDVRVLTHNGNSASTMFADFLDFLRLTGTELPSSNAEIALMIPAAFDDHFAGSEVYDEKLATTFENFARDMEVIADSLRLIEED